MKIRKYLKKSAPLLIVPMMLLFIGVFFVVSAENQINSQKAQITSLQKTIKTSNDQITKLSSENASESARIQTLLNQPKPTPEIEYVTQYQTVTEPATKQPVQYNSYGGDILYGSDGSTCNSYGGNTLYCNP